MRRLFSQDDDVKKELGRIKLDPFSLIILNAGFSEPSDHNNENDSTILCSVVFCRKLENGILWLYR